VVSHLRFGDVEGSLVRTNSAEVLLALEENEAYRNIPFLRRGGLMVVNAKPGRFPREETKHFLDRKEIIYRSIPADAIAQKLGAPLSSNLALLGYFSAGNNAPFGHQELRAVIERISPERFREKNLAIFDAGLGRASEEKGA
jgi:indolepyruvate ferredoxin oxidoreductase beta subunit